MLFFQTRCVRAKSRGFEEGLEPSTNVAGVEIVAPLCLVLLLFIISTIALALKLRRVMQSQETDEIGVAYQTTTKEAGETEGLTTVQTEKGTKKSQPI